MTPSANRVLKGLAAGAAALPVIGFLVWRLLAPPAVPHAAVVFDRSGSPTFTCEAVVSLARKALAMPGVVKESNLVVIATGEPDNKYQGELVTMSALPLRTAAITGRTKQLSRQNAYLDELRASCAALTKSSRSPILYAVSAAVAQLRSLGCDGEAGCLVGVASDAAENVDPLLSAALKGDARAERALTPVIDNTGIAITFCGVAQVSAPPGAKPSRADADRVGHTRRVWSAVFKDPALVVAIPFCGAASAQAAQ